MLLLLWEEQIIIRCGVGVPFFGSGLLKKTSHCWPSEPYLHNSSVPETPHIKDFQRIQWRVQLGVSFTMGHL